MKTLQHAVVVEQVKQLLFWLCPTLGKQDGVAQTPDKIFAAFKGDFESADSMSKAFIISLPSVQFFEALAPGSADGWYHLLADTQEHSSLADAPEKCAACIWDWHREVVQSVVFRLTEIKLTMAFQHHLELGSITNSDVTWFLMFLNGIIVDECIVRRTMSTEQLRAIAGTIYTCYKQFGMPVMHFNRHEVNLRLARLLLPPGRDWPAMLARETSPMLHFNWIRLAMDPASTWEAMVKMADVRNDDDVVDTVIEIRAEADEIINIPSFSNGRNVDVSEIVRLAEDNINPVFALTITEEPDDPIVRPPSRLIINEDVSVRRTMRRQPSARVARPAPSVRLAHDAGMTADALAKHVNGQFFTIVFERDFDHWIKQLMRHPHSNACEKVYNRLRRFQRVDLAIHKTKRTASDRENLRRQMCTDGGTVDATVKMLGELTGSDAPYVFANASVEALRPKEPLKLSSYVPIARHKYGLVFSACIPLGVCKDGGGITAVFKHYGFHSLVRAPEDDTFMWLSCYNEYSMIGKLSVDNPWVMRGMGVFWHDAGITLILERVNGPTVDKLLSDLYESNRLKDLRHTGTYYYKTTKNPDVRIPVLTMLCAQLLHVLYRLHLYERIVHFDLKPMNIMLTKQGMLKLIDFDGCSDVPGTAVLWDDIMKATCKTSWLGTFPYTSPWHLSTGKPAKSASADYFSAAIIFLELVTPVSGFFMQKRPTDATSLVDFVKRRKYTSLDAATLPGTTNEIPRDVPQRAAFIDMVETLLTKPSTPDTYHELMRSEFFSHYQVKAEHVAEQSFRASDGLQALLASMSEPSMPEQKKEQLLHHLFAPDEPWNKQIKDVHRQCHAKFGKPVSVPRVTYRTPPKTKKP